MTRMVSSKTFQGSVTFVAFLVVFAVYSVWLGGRFTNVDARALDVHQNAPVLLLGLAVLVTLIPGQFDLSVASMATLTCFLTVGLSIKQEWPFAVVLVACLLAGIIGGAVNGALIVRLRMNPFIATLGTGGVMLGLSAAYSGGAQIVSTSSGGELPSWFSGPDAFGALSSKFPSVLVWAALAAAAVLAWSGLRYRKPARISDRGWQAMAPGLVLLAAAALIGLGLNEWVDAVSWTIGVLFVIAIALWVLIDWTTFGRHLRAAGSNPAAARLAGLRPDRDIFLSYMLGGLLAATAGIFLASNQGTASPNAAVPFLLPAFAAAFLSTVILSTGRLHVWGTILGGIFLVWVSQGLIVGGVPFTWTEVVNGMVLLTAVAISTAIRRQPT